MQLTDIIKRPIISEKMSTQTEKLGKYGFIVDIRANKLQIRNAVEKFYGVTVKEVKTMTNPGKASFRGAINRSSQSKGQSSAIKKAIVTLATGETINLYSNV